MKEHKPNLIYYIGKYVLEEGIQYFRFPRKMVFVCYIEEPHLVDTHEVFLSDKKKDQAFVFCQKHHDFFDVSCNPNTKFHAEKEVGK